MESPLPHKREIGFIEQNEDKADDNDNNKKIKKNRDQTKSPKQGDSDKDSKEKEEKKRKVENDKEENENTMEKVDRKSKEKPKKMTSQDYFKNLKLKKHQINEFFEALEKHNQNYEDTFNFEIMSIDSSEKGELEDFEKILKNLKTYQDNLDSFLPFDLKKTSKRDGLPKFKEANAKFNKELESKEAEIQDLKTKSEELGSTIVEKNTKIELLKKSLKEKKEELDEVTKKDKALMKDLQRQIEEKNQIIADNKKLDSDIKKITNESQKQKEEFEKIEKGCKNQIKELKENNKKLSDEISKLVQREKNYNDQINENMNQIVLLNEEINNLKEALKVSKSKEKGNNLELEKVQKELKNCQEKLKNLMSEKEKILEELQEWKNKFENLSIEFNKIQNELLEFRKRVRELEAQVTHLKDFKIYLEKQHEESIRDKEKINKELQQKFQQKQEEIKDKEKINQELQEKVQQKQEEINAQFDKLTRFDSNLNLARTQIKTLLSEKKAEEEKFTNKINDLNKNITSITEKLETQINDLNVTIKDQKKSHKNLKKEKTALENEKTAFEIKNNELNDQITHLESQYQKYKDRFNDSKQEFLEFKAHFNLFKEAQKKEKSQNPKSKKEKLPYDMIINIDSLKTQNLGWEITMNEDSFDLINNNSKTQTIIGFVGPENIGKTFILNKICGFDLPSGSNVNTKGLSLKYSNHKGLELICLDSAGIHTPVYYFEEKLLKRFGILKEDLKKNDEIKRQMINDRTITDIFIQDFILDVCEVILIVVGQLSQNDQKFIERIVWKYQAKKRIIVVHNFSNLYSVADVERKIERDIVKAFDTISRIIPETEISEYIEKSEKKGCENISHLVLGVDWSESGEKYNNGTFGYLKKILETRTEKKSFDVIPKLQDFFKDNYRLYLRFKKRPVKEVCLDLNKKENTLIIKTDEEFEVSNPVFNSMGSLVTNPPYEVFERKDVYIVLIEIPDLREESLKFSIDNKKNDFNCLVVTGIKNWSEMMDSKKNKGVNGNRMIGDFKCIIPLGPSWYKATVQENNREYDRGILKVEVKYLTEEVEEM